MTADDKQLYCQIIAQLLLIDGAVTDEERAFLVRLMERLDMDEDDQKKVYNNVNIDDDIEAKAAKISPDVRDALIGELQEAAMADGDLGGPEKSIIARVTEAFESA